MTTLSFYKTKSFLFGAGLTLGVVALLAVRYFSYMPAETHYHANFAVYLNGQREEFKGPQYYQEIAACIAHGPIQPAQRAHMHDNINSVIHVHADGVTWDQFFDNIGWYIGPDFVETDTGTMYKDTGDSKVHIVLNGRDLTGLTTISNKLINDRDRLLLSVGSVDTATLQSQYESVPSTAKHYDESNDQASCAGQMDKLTVSDRIHHLF